MTGIEARVNTVSDALNSVRIMPCVDFHMLRREAKAFDDILKRQTHCMRSPQAFEPCIPPMDRRV